MLNKVANIIREEMDGAGAQELLMPVLHPQELWAESGREATMREVLIGFKDRKGTQYYLGPTHEEVITDLVRRNVRSYRELPLILYQIQEKFRDEPRPRGGLVRAREFLMKDAYSFDRDEAGLDAAYRQMYGTYVTIFQRCGLDDHPGGGERRRHRRQGNEGVHAAHRRRRGFHSRSARNAVTPPTRRSPITGWSLPNRRKRRANDGAWWIPRRRIPCSRCATSCIRRPSDW